MAVDTPRQHAWPWFVAAGAVYTGTLAGTWWPRAGSGEPNLVPFRPHLQDIRRGPGAPAAAGARRDLAINVVLLMPTALLLARGFRRSRGERGAAVPAAVLGCAGSLIIEVGQVFIPGRVPDATDVVLNCLGVLISVGASRLTPWSRHRRAGVRAHWLPRRLTGRHGRPIWRPAGVAACRRCMPCGLRACRA